MEKNSKNEQLPEGKGFIYNMVGWLAQNRTTVYIFTFIIFVAGIGIYSSLPKEQFPDIVVPQMVIQTSNDYSDIKLKLWPFKPGLYPC